MKQTLKDSIAAAKTKLVKQGIPSDIYNEFIEQICLATRVEHPDDTYTANRNRMNKIREQQSRLGEEALLKGFLHIEWTKALNEVWTPPDTDNDGKKIHKKDPLEQSVCLLRALWDIFEAQWACRNDILHGKESHVIEKDTERKTNRLLEFRTKKTEMLRRSDHWMIEYPADDIIKWSRSTKIRTLQNLEKLKRIYDKEKQQEATRLRPITDFFQVVPRPAPAAPA